MSFGRGGACFREDQRTISRINEYLLLGKERHTEQGVVIGQGSDGEFMFVFTCPGFRREAKLRAIPGAMPSIDLAASVTSIMFVQKFPLSIGQFLSMLLLARFRLRANFRSGLGSRGKSPGCRAASMNRKTRIAVATRRFRFHCHLV